MHYTSIATSLKSAPANAVTEDRCTCKSHSKNFTQLWYRICWIHRLEIQTLITANNFLTTDRARRSEFVPVLANKQHGTRRISDPWGRTKAAKRRPRTKNRTTSRHLCRRMNRRESKKKIAWRYVFENWSFLRRKISLFEGVVPCLILQLFCS